MSEMCWLEGCKEWADSRAGVGWLEEEDLSVGERRGGRDRVNNY